MEQTKPSFFKILINDFSTRLQIPPAFINMFGEVIPNKTILEAFGKTVQVKVEKIGKRMYFSNGWSEFVKANNLELGDLLLFKYFPDHSKFKVTVYGKTCCVKQFNKPVAGKEDQNNVEEARKRKKQVENEGFVEAKRMKSEFDSTEAINVDSDSSSSSDDDDDNETVADYMRKSMCKQEEKSQTIVQFEKRSENDSRILVPDYDQIEFTSENPFFQVQLQFSYIAGTALYIPARFVSEHMMMKESKKVRFEISLKTWNMKLEVVERRRGVNKAATINQGWKRFVNELHLQIGDACFFELIKSDDPDFVFNVHVYRWDRQMTKFYKIF